MKPQKFLGLIVIFIGIGLITGAGIIAIVEQNRLSAASSGQTEFKQPTLPLWQSEPLVPTALPDQLPTSHQALNSIAALTSTTALPTWQSLPKDVRQRFGIGVPFPPLEGKTVQELQLGWYLVWRVLETPSRPGNIDFWQMIRVHENGFTPDKITIEKIARTQLGTTWLIGNEPDVIWQDNVTPARYAQWYHDLYQILKQADPSCQVAIGGVTQPTPLRLRYLEQVLSSYQARYGETMPVDIWNIHNFILREERGSWGVDIPPGITVDHGILYNINDHDNLEIFKTQLISFRQWMADHGQQDKPLIISEYGILMPEDYGFGPQRVQRFLYGTYELMLEATDVRLGYPADDYRLVQRWAWYSLSDNRYPTGNFIDFTTGELTNLGQAHQTFVSNLP